LKPKQIVSPLNMENWTSKTFSNILILCVERYSTTNDSPNTGSHLCST